MKLTRQGVRLYHDRIENGLTREACPITGSAASPPSGVEEEGTDYGAIKQGYISVTPPLQMDMTDYKRLESLSGQLSL